MTVVFAQGMRRSGTTILFDLFWDDPRFTCWYEPLNRVRDARGGGSKVRDVDYMHEVVALRERFLAERGDADLDQDALNWGAPRAPELEFDAEWPPHVRDFVTAMAGSAEQAFVKFTRASHKLGELARIRPDAHFLHLVRDPRSVATSHIFRRAPEIKQRIVAEGTFFTATTEFDQWRSETMANHLVATIPDYARFADEPAHVKIMLLWRELYVRTRDDARRFFPERRVLVTHEALCADAVGALKALHRTWEGKPSWRACRWARRNVRPAKPWHEPENPAWERALDLLELRPLLEEIAADGLTG